MKPTYILAFASLVIFLTLFVFSKNPRRFYILFIFFFFPLIDLPVTPAAWGSFKVFDAISYMSFLVLAKDFWNIDKKYNVYFFLSCLLICSLLIGSLNSDYIKNSLVRIFSIFPIFIFVKSLINECVQDDKFQQKIVWYLKLIAIISIVFLLIQILTGLNFTFYSKINQNTTEGAGIRYPSFFQEPQKFGQFLAILIFLFLINNFQIKKPKLKNYLFFSFIVFGIVASGGRSAFIGLFAGLFLLFFILGPQFKMIVIATILIGFILFLNFSNSLLILKRSESFSGDLSYRSSIWNEAFKIFESKPLFGIGIGNYKPFAISNSKNYYITADKDVIFFDQPESGYLMILSETGGIGFILVFSLLLIPVISTLRYHNHVRKNLKLFFFIAGIFSWLVSFASLYSLSDKRVLIVLITLIAFVIFENMKLNYEN